MGCFEVQCGKVTPTVLFTFQRLSFPDPLIRIAAILLICTSSLPAATVTIETVHLEPAKIEEDPQTFSKVFIDGTYYKCSLLPKGWSLTSNLYGMHLVALPPSGDSGFAAIRVEPYADPKGNPITVFNKELFDSEFKRIKPETLPEEGADSIVQTSPTSVEFDFIRIENGSPWKCHYALSIVDGQLWTFGCESLSPNFESVMATYHLMFASFSKMEESK